MNSDLRDLCARLCRDDASLTILNLNNGGIGTTGIKAISAALRFNTHLVVLFLDDCSISGSGCQALAAGIAHHPALEFLFMSYNSVANTGASALALALRENRKIQVVKLTNCGITAQGAAALGETLRHSTTLQKLNLEGNHIGEKGALALAAGLEDNHSLLQLNIRYNGIQRHSEMLSVFCAVLHSHNKTLQKLLLAEDTEEIEQKSKENADDLQFYLDLNRIGRHSFGSCNVSASVWSRVLAAASRKPRLLHAVLNARPDLLHQTPVD
jgi:Ran GTPase-activating protein (RanGAP) involved in mRNA processing and transport